MGRACAHSAGLRCHGPWAGLAHTVDSVWGLRRGRASAIVAIATQIINHWQQQHNCEESNYHDRKSSTGNANRINGGKDTRRKRHRNNRTRNRSINKHHRKEKGARSSP